MNNQKSISEEIMEAVKLSRPYCTGKIGSVEASCVVHKLSSGLNRNWNTPGHGKTLRLALGENAGIFPLNDLVLDRWVSEFVKSVSDLDSVLQWCPEYGDQAIIDNFCANVRRYNSFDDLEPFFIEREKNWFTNLKGKKVLIVSPFEHSIKKQIPNISKIWEEDLSSIEFEVLKFPYSPFVSGQQHDKSFYHLQKRIYSEINSISFDVAIVGAGAYSIPIIAKVKSLGKVGIHLGGALQLLFGIKGRRWDNNEKFKDSSFYNSEFWIRPLEDDLPKNSIAVEGGCYW